MQTVQFLSAFLGSIIGFILALTGAGGAILAVPLLIFGLGLSVAEAAPIALFAVCISAAAGALLALKQGRVRYRAASLIALLGILAAPGGVFLAQKIPNAPLVMLFSGVLAYAASRMFRQSMENGAVSSSGPPPCGLGSTGRLIWTGACARSLALSGIIAGVLSGLLGVGGGFVVVPALRKATGLDMSSIVSTSLAVIALVSAAGVISTAIMGSISWSIALPFGAGAVVSMLLGSQFGRHLKGPRLQQAFAFLAGCVAAIMFANAVLGILR